MPDEPRTKSSTGAEVPVAPVVTERLELVSLGAEVLEALAQGRVDDASRSAGLAFPATWPAEMEWLLRYRLDQMREDPAARPWLLRAIVLKGTDEVIGHINFHEPPDPERNAVEIGYTIEPAFRRRGYAHEAVIGMFDWAEREHGILHFIASVSPTNDPSLKLIDKLGFERTGVQWDELDGEEIVFELVRSANRRS